MYGNGHFGTAKSESKCIFSLRIYWPNLSLKSDKIFFTLDVPDLGEIVQAKLDFCGIGRGVGPNTVNQTPDIPNPTLLTTAVKSEVLEEL